MEGGVRWSVEIIPGRYFLELDVLVVAWRETMVSVVTIRLCDSAVDSRMDR